MKSINDIKITPKEVLHNQSLDFLNQGLACHAICFLHKSGVLKDLIRIKMGLSIEEIYSVKNKALLRATLVTLIGAGICAFGDNKYRLTEFGLEIAKGIGAIAMPLIGYRSLFEKQYQMIDSPVASSFKDIDYASIAEASIDFGAHTIDPPLIEIFRKLKLKGTICDLGCGEGDKLANITSSLQLPGLGIERDPKIAAIAETKVKDLKNIEILQGDITKLKGIWEDVEVALISMVLHDFNPAKECKLFINSLIDNFPRLRYLIVADIVSLSHHVPSILPGFDYVHGLQGIIPRTYEETMELFTLSKFSLIEEVSVDSTNNTFIWVLEKPDKKRYSTRINRK